MFLMLVCILSVIAGILTGVTGHAAWQAVLAALGCFVGLNLLYVIWWVLVAAFVHLWNTNDGYCLLIYLFAHISVTTNPDKPHSFLRNSSRRFSLLAQ